MDSTFHLLDKPSDSILEYSLAASPLKRTWGLGAKETLALLHGVPCDLRCPPSEKRGLHLLLKPLRYRVPEKGYTASEILFQLT